ncbi:hypothetical protein BC826DRAFT_1186821 [Russula brevipes]|nr:hypothetical protein BC826DRAFT_1186821 [Russula brevipes]
MTSTSLVQIIDLTGSPPPIYESQSVRKSTDYGADPDPDKYATPTVRKRRNGELARARSRPVESRGASLERRHVRAEEGTKSQLAEDAQGSNGESTRKKKRRSKKSKGQHKDSPPSSRDDTAQHDAMSSLHDGQLFFVDVAPATVPAGVVFNSAGSGKDAQPSVQAQASEPDRVPLLLPAHVSVLDPGDDLPVQIIQPADSDSDSESYIEYLDYGIAWYAPDVVRYFKPPTEEQKHVRFVCKRCGAEGEHRTNECPVLICLTCGARDEHTTRSCPISKTCFSCGMKGHINKDCPNRHSGGMVNNYDDCDRCGSDMHNTNECPTIWRLYEYVTDHEREAILQLRESKQSLALGQGGEGYIASDEWCYNCGDNGHLGDDCKELPRPQDAPSAPSAFGLYNTLSGPFSDAAARPIFARAPRDWENGETFGDGWGTSAPINVGKRARNRERERMERRALELEQQEQDDAGDWFENARNARNRGTRDARHDHHRPSAGGGGGGGRGRGRGRRESSPGAAAATGGGRGVGRKDAKIRLARAWKSDDPPHRKPTLLERVHNNDNDNDIDVDADGDDDELSQIASAAAAAGAAGNGSEVAGSKVETETAIGIGIEIGMELGVGTGTGTGKGSGSGSNDASAGRVRLVEW